MLFGTRTLTRGELDTRAGALAAGLAARGIGRGHRVAVALERAPETIVALLGVLRAGAAFLPVDPAYPAARGRGMMGDYGDRKSERLTPRHSTQARMPSDGRHTRLIH
ncbi:hypothetical protein CCS92_35435 [Methylobacterium radiotolerans]|nr:hypothetical protein CCS92_35435 [Methylobacterium radiotolerans]